MDLEGVGDLLLRLLQVKNSHRLRQVIRNTGWLFADRMLRIGVGLFVGVWVARYLGPANYGILNYAIAFVALFSALSSLGLDSIVVRELVQNAASKHEILGTTFTLRLLGSLMAMMCAITGICVLRPADHFIHCCVAIIAVGSLFQSSDTIDLWFQSQVESKYAVYAKTAAFLVVSCVKIVLLQLRAPLIAFVWMILAEVVLGALGLIFIYRHKDQHLALWRFSLDKGRQLFSASWPLIFSGLAIMVYMKIDLIMLGEMIGNRAVGLYSAATRLSEIWYFIPTSIVTSVFPSIVEAKQVGSEVYYARLQKLFDIMSALGLAIAIPMTFLSGSLIRLFFGDGYAAAGSILTIHIWSALFVFLGSAQTPWFVSEGLTPLFLKRTVLGAIINVGLNIALIPAYAGLGAAVATVIAYAVSGVLANVLDTRTRPILTLQLRSMVLANLFRFHSHRP
jgi:PST family polysaccharide transporter